MGFMKDFGSAIIGGVGTLGGAALQARAQNKATDASSKATAAALEYTKQQDALRRADYQAALEAWNNNRNVLLQHLGLPASSAVSLSSMAPTGYGSTGEMPLTQQPVEITQSRMGAPTRAGSLADVLQGRGQLGAAFQGPWAS